MPPVRELSATAQELEGGKPVKRAKTAHTDPMDQAMETVCKQLATKNAGLKGRRRFVADRADMIEACNPGMDVKGFCARQMRAGEDEGAVEFAILHGEQHLLNVHLLVSDTSEYPKEHAFYAFTPDASPPAPLLAAIETISAGGARTLVDTVRRALEYVARAINPALYTSAMDDTLPDDGDGDGSEMDDDDDSDANMALDSDDDSFGLPTTHTRTLDLSILQSDFIDLIASSYRLGFLPFGTDAFSLSVSLPITALAALVPPHALHAWDRHILRRPQHLALLVGGFRGVYPVLDAAGAWTPSARARGVGLSFRVGLCGRYKPGKAAAQEAARAFVLVVPDTQEDVPAPAQEGEWVDDEWTGEEEEEKEEEEVYDPDAFVRFALSQSLESLLEAKFLRLLQLRLRYSLGWAGAEMLLAVQEKMQSGAQEVYDRIRANLKMADRAERELVRTYGYQLPDDPLVASARGGHLNLPLLAFAYLLRRLMLCSKFCMVCHTKLDAEYEPLKPYVCASKLCAYQYYQLNMGPSLEYEICANPDTLDLLLSMTFCAAAEGRLDPLPSGLGIRVPLPRRIVMASARRYVALPGAPTGMLGFAPPIDAAPAAAPPQADPDGLIDFEKLDDLRKMASVAELLDTVPAVPEMKTYLDKKLKAGRARPLVRNMAPEVLDAAWALVRWCLGSCTAHLEMITDPDEMVQNVDPSWQQYRFSVGAPEAEAKFARATEEAQRVDENARTYPSLYAFHGSPFRNWHSIIRNGLWYKEVAHGRAFGHGVYFSLLGEMSMNSYAVGTSTRWKNSTSCPTNGVALAQIVNLPNKFTSRSPYLVVPETSWIICRYLLIKTSTQRNDEPANADVPFVPLDPQFKLTIQQKAVSIPQPAYKLTKKLSALRAEHVDEEYDAEDRDVFEHGADALERRGRKEEKSESEDEGDEDDYDESWAYDDHADAAPARPPHALAPVAPPPPPAAPAEPDWEHDPPWVEECVAYIMAPPSESSNGATLALQRELKAMLKEQRTAKSARELGWYMPPESIEDNLYQWIVEMHSFEEGLPVAKDMKAQGVNSLVFEIRFPGTFPHAPPFFRILKPRFLPFSLGGGGHITGGGSICMDLLTSHGWLPSYGVPAILLQIRMAISNLDPHPAQLASNWNTPYTVGEALQGYKRAAAAHGWAIPAGVDRLVL